jgi:hypothetical protein
MTVFNLVDVLVFSIILPLADSISDFYSAYRHYRYTYQDPILLIDGRLGSQEKDWLASTHFCSRSLELFTRVCTYVQRGSKFCFVVIGLVVLADTLLRILHISSAYCHIACSLAQQPCPAALPGSLARQPCPAALPGSLARQPCPAALPGSPAQQPCRNITSLITGPNCNSTAVGRLTTLHIFTGRREGRQFSLSFHRDFEPFVKKIIRERGPQWGKWPFLRQIKNGHFGL